MTPLTNTTFDEIKVGQSATISRTLSQMDIEVLAYTSGDADAYHLETGQSAKEVTSTEAVAAQAFFGHLLNRRLPGPGTTIVAANFELRGRLSIGDTVSATVTAKEKRTEGALVVFECQCINQKGEKVATGLATVVAPKHRVTYADLAMPEVIFRRTDVFARLIENCQHLQPVKTAVVHPCDQDSLVGPIEAARRKLILPVLVGPETKIRATAEAANVDLGGIEIIPTEHSHAAAEKAVAMARSGEVEALMKGSLHTDELMAAVVHSATGLRTSRRISHVFVLDVPAYPRMLLVSDAAINIAPDLKAKVDIVQNAIDLARVLGIELPRVAILSAVETVNPEIPSTLDAAALCKMAQRGQITGGLLDGPLAFDNAISELAAKTKKIASEVAGKTDVLIAPDIEAGNMLAKQLQYLAGADAAGIVLGARVPIVLTSRADTVRTRLASTAVLVRVARANERSVKRHDDKRF